MANEILQKVGDQIRFVVTGSFAPVDDGTNWTIGTPTDVLLTMAGVASGASRQSDKVDLGVARAATYEVLGCVDFTGETPTQGETVEYYWAPSTSATQANGNVLGNSGADGDAPDGAVGTPTQGDLLAGCQFIGTLVVHDGAAVQNGLVGVFSPSSRHGQLILLNSAGDAFANDDVEMHQVFNPIIDEVQSA